MNAQDVIEATKKRADWARDVEAAQQMFSDGCALMLTVNEDLQNQGIVMAHKALNMVSGHKNISFVPRAGVDE